MKDDYLWDKTGSDPEVEKLEKALKMFRGTDLNPPKISQQTFAFEDRSNRVKAPRRLFSFGIAAFACAALIVFGIGVFRSFKTATVETVKTDSARIAQKPEAIETAKVTRAKEVPSVPLSEKNEQKNSIDKIVFKSPRSTQVRRKTRRVQRTANSKISNAKVSPTITAQNEEVVLTEEEQYAYQQLMLGLSITSSNLKIVKDKANGVSETVLPKKIGR